ncbi:unnamed protein product [Caenorhabditis auriculariae]|uniref:Uncharacterized protein n=1 Tax=Caenorhabditis auriculariae TaxID=2777116 RepID=A0A8S1GW12_9PELO|nr:unnamed protein product [Caenorhabditis auriculariae]
MSDDTVHRSDSPNHGDKQMPTSSTVQTRGHLAMEHLTSSVDLSDSCRFDHPDVAYTSSTTAKYDRLHLSIGKPTDYSTRPAGGDNGAAEDGIVSPRKFT